MADYTAPVSQLLTLGEPLDSEDWLDYRQRGLGPEHVPDLIRMATDSALNLGKPDSAEVWAPIHACRALGQLRADSAVEPLLQLLDWAAEQHDDWLREELPIVLGVIGPQVLPRLAAFLADPSHEDSARWSAANAVVDLVEHFPETRAEGIAVLCRQLEAAEKNDPELNGMLVGSLLDLQAVEAAPVLERAFDGGQVDESIAGDWPQVRWELGLSDEPPSSITEPLKNFNPPAFLPGPPGDRLPRPVKAKEKAKKKRKQAALSRKRNRKR